MTRFWREPLFVNEGDTVWLPYNEMAWLRGEAEGLMAWRCKVLAAHGNHATIVYRKEKGGEPIVKHLVRLTDLLVPPDDYRHPDNSEQIVRDVWKAVSQG
jgi:hypothetical protein